MSHLADAGRILSLDPDHMNTYREDEFKLFAHQKDPCRLHEQWIEAGVGFDLVSTVDAYLLNVQMGVNWDFFSLQLQSPKHEQPGDQEGGGN